MPRSTRDSDEEAKLESVIPGRRTRAFAGATDSPLRRSTRIKQPAGQDESSPESPLSDNTNTGSNVQQRVTRRRSTVMELTIEKQRILRPRKNSVSSDVSEINEEVSTPSRKTRRSVAAIGSSDTPKTRASTRLTRAGSETKSPPSVLKITRKTRASSMGPETTMNEKKEEKADNNKTEQPMKQRRRASVLPSEATVIEENEENHKILVVQLDRTLSPLIESKETGKKNILTDLITSRVTLSNDKVDTSPNNITDGRTEGYTHGQKAENLFTGVLEEPDKNISNKENQATNIINDAISERTADSVVINASLQSPKPLTPNISIADKTIEDKNKSCITESPLTKSIAKIPTKDDASSITGIEVNDTSQVMSSSMDITNADPSSCNISTGESEISLKLVNPNVNLSLGKCAQSDELKDESKLNVECQKDDVKHDINKSSSEKLEPDKSATEVVEISNVSPIKDAREKSEDSTVAEIDKILQENSSTEGKEEAEGQLITEQKSDAKEDSQKLEMSEETKENDTCDSTDTMPCSNLSGLTALETSDLLPLDSNESIKKAVPSADKKEESEILNVSSCTLNKDVSSNTTQPLPGPSVSEQNKIEETQKAAIQASPEKKLTGQVQDVEEEKKCDNTNNDIQKDNEISSETNAENLFQDISADEWRKERQRNTDPEVNSVHSLSTERLDNESEAECDLILVDRDAWLAAENMKAEKENEMFDYDSDDTVVLKSRLDSSKSQQQTMELSMLKEESNENVKEDNLPNSKNNGNTSRSTETASAEKEGTDEKMEEIVSETKDADKNTNSEAEISNIEQLEEINEMNSSVSKSKEKKRLSKSDKIEKEEEECDPRLNKSAVEKSCTRRSKPLRESTDDANNRKHPSNSGERDSDEDKKFKKVAIKSPNLTEGLNESATSKNSSTKSAITPGKKNNEKRTLSNLSDKRKVVLKQLDADSSESESTSEIGSSMSKKVSTILMQKSGKKIRSPNYSMYVHVGSGSDVANDNVDSDTDNSEIGGRKIPKFLFNDTSSNESETDEKDSINSDINREYNLDGKSSPKFSDDDVPGDECRASESEYSDPDDNGSDLADFVVDDDEIEEDDDDETEEKEGNNDDEESEEGEEVMEENENGESDEDKNSEEAKDEDERPSMKMKVLEKESEEEQGEEEAKLELEEEEGDEASEKADEGVKITEKRNEVNTNQVGATTEQEKCIENDIVEDAEEQQNTEEDETKESNDEMTVCEFRNSSKEGKSKSNISADLISPEKRHKKKKRKSNENSVNKSKEANSDTSCLSSAKKKQAQKQYSNETTEEAAEQRFNTESPIAYAKTMNKFNQLSDCSTPKSTISKHEPFEISIRTPNLSLECETKKTSSSSCKKSSGVDRSLKPDSALKKLNKSKDLEQSLLHKSLPVDLTELAEKTNLRRLMSSKVVQLNKSMLTPNSNTPTTKFLKKDKQNESLPALKFEGTSKKLLRLNLAKEMYNASLLANRDVTDESDKDAEEPKVSLLCSPKEDVLCTVESKPILKKEQKHKRAKKANTENVEIIAAEQDTVTRPKNRKRTYLMSAPEMDNFDEADDISEKKEKKKKKKKQKAAAESKGSEISENALYGDTCEEETGENTDILQKKKRKEKRKLKAENMPETADVERCIKVTKKLKVKSTNDDVSQARVEKLLKKKQSLQNLIPSKIGSTKISKRIEEPTEQNADKDKDLMVIAAAKAEDEEVDVKISKGIKKKRAKEQLEIVEYRKDGKRRQLESKTVSKIDKMKTTTKNTLESLNQPLVKRRKASKKEKQLLPSRSGFVEANNILVEDDYSSPSLCQGVTHFEVVDLKTVMKPKKNSNAVTTFKQRMLARNNRQPTSAYLMYLKKQKASGKGRNSDTSF